MVSFWAKSLVPFHPPTKKKKRCLSGFSQMVTLGLGEIKATHTWLHSWEVADLGWEPWGWEGRVQGD